MNFIGRDEEQKNIKNLIKKEGYQGCIIYGRRRMGKTELIKKCLIDSNIPFIMYKCKESSERDNLEMFTEQIKRNLNNSYLSFNTFIEAINYLFEYSLNNQLILVLDEYPYIRELIPGCDSKLQNIIDNYIMNSSMKLFLLGSSIKTMEDLLSLDSPLYMRFQTSILLKQMDYYDSQKFYSSFTNEDKVALYSTFGGVPYFNSQIDSRLSVKDNIINLICKSSSGLKEFIETYLKQELRKINDANSIFEAIANGSFHYSDIFSKSHIESSPLLNTVLKKLQKMNLIEYIYPINNKDDKRKSGYRISDSCIRFYYKFIYRNESAHSILNDSDFYDTFIHEEFYKEFVPKTFEEISKQYLIRLNKQGKFNPILIDIGTFWYDNTKEKKNGQFDVVGKTFDGYIFFGCKYTKSQIDDDIISEEIRQVNDTNLKPVQYGFFSKNGFKLKKEYPYLFYTLDDIYNG